MKIVYVDKCRNCPNFFFTERDCEYKCKVVSFKVLETDQEIPEWCPLAETEYINPKQESTKMLQKLKCKYCGYMWFEKQPVTECEFVIHSDIKNGDFLSAITVGKLIYYRCMSCSRLTPSCQKVN